MEIDDCVSSNLRWNFVYRHFLPYMILNQIDMEIGDSMLSDLSHFLCHI